ncbi:MAG: YjbQ family protein [Archaeoglobi archaeon]|nr:YjbQ family protein [Candidatus Mnemosynella bozhongmuii]
MRSFITELYLETNGFSDIIDITPQVRDAVRNSEVVNGFVLVFIPGATAAVTTMEYESGLIEDMKRALEIIAPMNQSYKHDLRWGDGNGFSHVRASFLGPSLTIPVVNGEPVLGTWQQVVVIDMDNKPRKRRVVIGVYGE